MQLGSAAVNAVAGVIADQVSGGAMWLMGGRAPTDADRVTAATRLVEIPLGVPAFSAPTDGEMELLPAESARAIKGGRITWFCVVDAGGRCVFMGSADKDGGDLSLSRRMVTAGDTVTVDVFRYSVPRS